MDVDKTENEISLNVKFIFPSDQHLFSPYDTGDVKKENYQLGGTVLMY